MTNCKYCLIPNRKLTSKDYFEKMVLWRQYVSENLFEFKGGDCLLDNLEEEILNEEKYVYYHYFKCNCGRIIRSGVCIRSSEPILEYIEELPK
jgi:hypothetical protein